MDCAISEQRFSMAEVSMSPISFGGVPTQMIASSDFCIASWWSVVAKSFLFAIASLSRSVRLGSVTGEIPAFMASTFFCLISTPMMLCPSFARQAQLTVPTYPSPKILMFIFVVSRYGTDVYILYITYGRDENQTYYQF